VSSWLSGLRDRRWIKRLVRQTNAGLTPPDRAMFGSWGEGSFMCAPARVSNPQRIRVGAGVRIDEYAWLEVSPDPTGPGLTIEDGAVLRRFVKVVCFGSVTIGPGAVVSDRVYLGDVVYVAGEADVLPHARTITEPLPIVIGGGARLGPGVVVKPGVTVGENTTVAAGSVVSQDLPPQIFAAGNPARAVGPAT
jgi:acetyltransferase-like isoleucine patch superfamily enzyme